MGYLYIRVNGVLCLCPYKYWCNSITIVIFIKFPGSFQLT